MSGSQGINSSYGLTEQGHIDQSATALVTGQLGYAVNYDTIAGLFYFKGGAAFVNYGTYSISGNNAVTTCAVFASQGFRWMGLYENFGTHSITYTDVQETNVPSVKQNINELKLGINYRFGDSVPQLTLKAPPATQSRFCPIA